jgi:hypothetical protein
VPIYTVGIGATETIDLAVDLQTDPKMKRNERTAIAVNLRQDGLARPAGHGARDGAAADRIAGVGEARRFVIGQQTVSLQAPAAEPRIPVHPGRRGTL